MANQIAVIGSGAVGSSTAWHLARNGHEIILIDPRLNQPINRIGILNGTIASLGILMGNIYKRSSGRGWRLRQRSISLWKEWIKLLNSQENPLSLSTPLIQLASSQKEIALMHKLSKDRKNLALDLLPPNTGINFSRPWPPNPYGGLISHNDGRIEPLQLQKCLIHALDQNKVQKINESVLAIERKSTTKIRQWEIHLSNGKSYSPEIIVLCTAVGTDTLLKPLGHHLPIEPVLGQVLNLKLKDDGQSWANWPAVLNSNKKNLIPNGNNHLILGATLEPGTCPNAQALKEMQNLNWNAPNWLQTASVFTSWSGPRGRPKDVPAPILKKLEPGLIIATGHYRNGILLAPASAEWVEKEIRNDKENLSISI